MAVDNFVIWHRDATLSDLHGGGFVWDNLVKSTLKWTPSSSGTNEYYLEASGGGDPGLVAANDIYLDGKHNKATQGTAGSLNPGEWDETDNDSLGFSTKYVRLSDGADPDTKADNYVGMGKAGGIDHSQRATPILALTDLTSDGAGTGLYSPAGGFNAGMIYNIIYIVSGPGFTPGWYMITGVTDTNNITIDRSAGASATAGTGNVGGGKAIPTDTWYEAWGAGNKEYIKGGNDYTLTGSIAVSKDGNVSRHMHHEGFKTIRGDSPRENDRPKHICAANSFTFDNYRTFENIEITITNANGWGLDLAGLFLNCKSTNSSVTANRAAFRFGGSATKYIDCEGISTNGEAFRLHQGTVAHSCYAHDSYKGFTATSTGPIVSFCIADACADSGVDFNNNGAGGFINNCTIFGNGKGIKATAASSGAVVISNNLIDTNTTGISWSVTPNYTTFLIKNNFNANTLDCDRSGCGVDVTNFDPEFVSGPGAGNFAIGVNVQGIGTPGAFPSGRSTGYIDLGAVQALAAAGGGEKTFGYISG